MMRRTEQVRDAVAGDMSSIADIYARFVRAGTASFELDPPSADEMARRFATLAEGGFPYLVTEIDGAVVAYAYAGPYRPRLAYRFTLEDSIYVAHGAQGNGIGGRLMAKLLQRAEAFGGRQIIAVIGDPPAQPGSIALHRRHGFIEVGRLHAVGWKHGAWRDTLLMQRMLGEGDATR
jgi:L-amino acid N-acyltransferase YncA